MQRPQPLEQGGLILFRVHPAIPDTITLLVLRTLAMDQQWEVHAKVVTEDRVLMVKSGRSETPFHRCSIIQKRRCPRLARCEAE